MVLIANQLIDMSLQELFRLNAQPISIPSKPIQRLVVQEQQEQHSDSGPSTSIHGDDDDDDDSGVEVVQMPNTVVSEKVIPLSPPSPKKTKKKNKDVVTPKSKKTKAKKEKKTKAKKEEHKKGRKRDASSTSHEEESPKKKSRKEKKKDKREKKEKKSKKRDRSEEEEEEDGEEEKSVSPTKRKKVFDESSPEGQILKMIDVFGLMKEDEENLQKDEVKEALLASYPTHKNNKFTQLTVKSAFNRLAIHKRKGTGKVFDSTLTPVTTSNNIFRYDVIEGEKKLTKLDEVKAAVRRDYNTKNMNNNTITSSSTSFNDQLNYLINYVEKKTKNNEEDFDNVNHNALQINIVKCGLNDPYHLLLFKDEHGYHSFVDQTNTSSYNLVVLPPNVFYGKQMVILDGKKEEFRLLLDARTDITVHFETTTKKKKKKSVALPKQQTNAAVVVSMVEEESESKSDKDYSLENEDDEIPHRGPPTTTNDIVLNINTPITTTTTTSGGSPPPPPQTGKLMLSTSKQKLKEKEKIGLFTKDEVQRVLEPRLNNLHTNFALLETLINGHVDSWADKGGVYVK